MQVDKGGRQMNHVTSGNAETGTELFKEVCLVFVGGGDGNVRFRLFLLRDKSLLGELVATDEPDIPVFLYSICLQHFYSDLASLLRGVLGNMDVESVIKVAAEKIGKSLADTLILDGKAIGAGEILQVPGLALLTEGEEKMPATGGEGSTGDMLSADKTAQLLAEENLLPIVNTFMDVHDAHLRELSLVRGAAGTAIGI